VIRRLLLMIVVVAATAPVLGGGAAPPVLIARDVTIAGIPVGGTSYEQAQAIVGPAFAQPLRLSLAQGRWSVASSHFGGSVTVTDGLSKAFEAGPGDAVDLVPAIDTAAVQGYADGLAKRFSYPAKDAKLVGLKGLIPRFSTAKPGRQVEVGRTTKRLMRALEFPETRRMRVAFRVVAPLRTARSFGPVIVIRRGLNELRYYLGKRLVRKFGVATGQSVYPTPTGQFSIVVMERNPWWRPPDSPWARGLKAIPPGPGNPLGTRWMGLSAPGVGIHGTPDSASIGYSASHGCIRMYIPDAEWLFQHVHVGTPVVITDA
jgi:lipoprotein-anchoring transpeptidase ErfK/SrfK